MPAWTPGGDVAFARYWPAPDFRRYHLFVIHPDDSGPERLRNLGEEVDVFTWVR